MEPSPPKTAKRGRAGATTVAGASEPAPVPALSPPPPDLYAYLDYRIWLRDTLLHLAAADRRHSQRWLAKRAGFKSPQLLTMIIKGQRALTREKSLQLAKALKLDSRATEYLTLIVDLADCDNETARATLMNRIKSGFRDGLFAEISDEGIEISRDWYYPALREAVTLKEAGRDAFWYAERLGIDPADAQRALGTLVERGFLERQADGRLRRATPSVRTARHRTYPTLLGLYHLKLLERAFPAVRLPRDRRHFEALTFAIPRQLVPEIRERILKFFREIDDLVEAGSGDRDEVMQLHLSLFPLTRWQEPPPPAQGGPK